MYYIYIIFSKSTNKYYTGLTSNISSRLKQHTSLNSGTRSTKNITDYMLVYCQIEDTLKSAREIEKYLKSGSGREIRKDIIKYWSQG